tara:strand:+ start:77 stop:496 length:420 start_codon:yes stop_codon:yes gene_type:complete
MELEREQLKIVNSLLKVIKDNKLKDELDFEMIINNITSYKFKDFKNLIKESLENKTKYHKSALVKIQESEFYKKWNLNKIQDNAWHDILDCYKVLEVKPNLKNEPLFKLINDYMITAYDLKKHDLVLFLRHSIWNITSP